MNNMELYQEEQRQILLDVKAGITGLSKLIQKQIDSYVAPTDNVEVTGKVEVNTQDSVEVKNLSEVRDSVVELGKTLETAIKNNSYKPAEAVTVKNLKDVVIPDTVKINNLTELKEYFVTLAKAIVDNQPIVNVTKQDIVFPTDPKKPIAVRLSDGRKFYEAITAAFSGGMSTAGLATDSKLDQVIEAVGGISGGRWGSYADARIDISSDPMYFGKENTNGDWVIKRINFTAGTEMYYEGTGGISSNWAGRAGYTYVEFKDL